MVALKEFLDAAPTAFHAAEVLASELESAGWLRLDEGDAWSLTPGQGYFLVRSGRSVAAFIPGSGDPAEGGLRIAASHLDSPLWKLKTEAAVRESGTWRLPVEAYGGPINRTWLDRELEIAGFVRWEGDDRGIRGRSWRSGGATAIIPSLAIHFDREVNKGAELNNQQHMAALMPGEDEGGNPVLKLAAAQLGCRPESILASELFLVPAEKASVIPSGPGGWIVSGRLDNLAMAHAVLSSLPEPGGNPARGVLAMWFDAEEIGSRTDSGAASVFPDEMVEPLVLAAGGGREDLMRTRRRSVMISADLAHATHPNYPEKHDRGYPVVLGGGPVLKSHGRRNYATDVDTESLLMSYGRRAGIPVQKMIFRSDTPCGMSLGPLASAMASIPTVDIGSPVWAMHSSRETADLGDHEAIIRLIREHWKA